MNTFLVRACFLPTCILKIHRPFTLTCLAKMISNLSWNLQRLSFISFLISSWKHPSLVNMQLFRKLGDRTFSRFAFGYILMSTNTAENLNCWFVDICYKYSKIFVFTHVVNTFLNEQIWDSTPNIYNSNKYHKFALRIFDYVLVVTDLVHSAIAFIEFQLIKHLNCINRRDFSEILSL